MTCHFGSAGGATKDSMSQTRAIGDKHTLKRPKHASLLIVMDITVLPEESTYDSPQEVMFSTTDISSTRFGAALFATANPPPTRESPRRQRYEALFMHSFFRP